MCKIRNEKRKKELILIIDIITIIKMKTTNLNKYRKICFVAGLATTQLEEIYKFLSAKSYLREAPLYID